MPFRKTTPTTLRFTKNPPRSLKSQLQTQALNTYTLLDDMIRKTEEEKNEEFPARSIKQYLGCLTEFKALKWDLMVPNRFIEILESTDNVDEYFERAVERYEEKAGEQKRNKSKLREVLKKFN